MSLIGIGCGGSPTDGAAPLAQAVAAESATAAPTSVRAVAPLSGSLAGAPRPQFRVSGARAALVEICADRACAHPLQAFVAVNGSGRPLLPLSPGVVFWRARAVVLTASAPWTSVWELVVPPGGSAAAATRGLRLDVDGDGFADAAVREQNGEAATDRLHVYRGGAGGLDPASDTVLTLDTSHFGIPAISAGDVNGDGFGDLAVADGRGLVIYAGSASGITAAPLSITPPAGIQPFLFASHVVAGGDVDGDGYADVFADDNDQHVWLYLGSPSGLSATPAWTLDRSNSGRFALLLTAADLNGDGFADLVIQDFGPTGTTQAFRVFQGSASGLESASAGTLVVRPNLPSGTAGDVNGDGIPDLVTSEVTQLAFFPGGPTFPPAVPTEVVPTAQRALPLQLADFNGDGLADLAAVTAVPSPTSFYFTDDRVDVYPGTPAGFAPAPTVTIHETDVLPDDTLNFVRLTAADFNRDRQDDLMVGAQAPFPTPFFDGTTPAVFVFDGSATGLQPAPALEITGTPGYASWVSAAAPQFP